MKMHALNSVWMLPLLLAASAAGQTTAEPAKAAAAKTELRLPPGMARADDAKQVEALYSEQNQKRVEAIQKAQDSAQVNAQDEYAMQLAAYRTQLVQEQLERKKREQEIEIEREARLRAELAALQLRREQQRESIYIQHHSVHAHQRNLNDEFWREQRLLRALEQQHHHHQTCPTPQPQPSPPAPAPQMTVSTGPTEETGDTLP